MSDDKKPVSVESAAWRIRNSVTLFPAEVSHFPTSGHKLRYLLKSWACSGDRLTKVLGLLKQHEDMKESVKQYEAIATTTTAPAHTSDRGVGLAEDAASEAARDRSIGQAVGLDHRVPGDSARGKSIRKGLRVPVR